MGNVLIDVVLPLALAFIMFTLGLGLKAADFTQVFAMPKAFAVGVVNQMVLLPLVGFAIAVLLGMPPELALGMMILGPGAWGCDDQCFGQDWQWQHGAVDFADSGCDDHFCGDAADYYRLWGAVFHGRGYP